MAHGSYSSQIDPDPRSELSGGAEALLQPSKIARHPDLDGKKSQISWGGYRGCIDNPEKIGFGIWGGLGGHFNCKF